MAASAELQAILDLMWQQRAAAESPPPITVDTVRAITDGLARPFELSDVSVTAVSAGGIPCEWLVPDGADETKRLLYLHGGGYIAGSLESHRAFCGDLAKATGLAILNADYRLAPDHRSPAQLDDAMAAYKWMQGNGPSGPSAAKACFIAGDSAGGGLTLALILALRAAGDAPPNAAVTLSAWTDMTVSGDSIVSCAASDPMINKPLIDLCASCTVGDSGDARDPRVSPLFGDYQGLPPLLMQVGENEMLRDDTLRCADKAKAAGVDLTLERYPDVYHVWQAAGLSVPEAATAIDHIADFVGKYH